MPMNMLMRLSTGTCGSNGNRIMVRMTCSCVHLYECGLAQFFLLLQENGSIYIRQGKNNE